MSINISPLDHQVHLKQFEPTFGGSNYDHSSQPVTGCKAERQWVENNTVANVDQSRVIAEDNGAVVGKNWITKFANLFILPRFAN